MWVLNVIPGYEDIITGVALDQSGWDQEGRGGIDKERERGGGRMREGSYAWGIRIREAHKSSVREDYVFA